MKEINEDFKLARPEHQEVDIFRDLKSFAEDIRRIQLADNQRKQESVEKILGAGLSIVDGSQKHPKEAKGDKQPKPESATEKESKQLAERSDKIYQACTWHGNDNEAVFRALADTTAEQREKMDQDFYKKHGQHIGDYLNEEMKRHPEMRDKALQMLNSKEKVQYAEYDPSVYGDLPGSKK